MYSPLPPPMFRTELVQYSPASRQSIELYPHALLNASELKTTEEILEGYPKIDNVAELLESDILVLPMHKYDGFGQYQQFGTGYENLTIKFYVDGEIVYKDKDSVDTLINLGSLIVSSLSAYIALRECLQKKHKDDTIKLTIYVKSGENVYSVNEYEGVGSDVCREKEIFPSPYMDFEKLYKNITGIDYKYDPSLFQKPSLIQKIRIKIKKWFAGK